MVTRKKESLEGLIRRIVRDSNAVGSPLTPRILATAIGSAGWKHTTAPLTEEDRIPDTRKR